MSTSGRWNPDLQLNQSLVADIDGVLSQFGIEDDSDVEPIYPIRRNENFRVSTDNGERFVLRHHRRNRDSSRVEFQLAFQEYLHAAGFPTARVHRTVAGSRAVDRGDGAWALFDLVDGEELDYSRIDQVQEAGRRLAEFHLERDGQDPVSWLRSWVCTLPARRDVIIPLVRDVISGHRGR